MRSRYHPDGSIDYDADRALEILRFADEELARRHQARQEEALLMSGGHGESDMVTKTPGATRVRAKATFPGMPEDPLQAFLNPNLMDLVPNPFATTTPEMAAMPMTTNEQTN